VRGGIDSRLWCGGLRESGASQVEQSWLDSLLMPAHSPHHAPRTRTLNTTTIARSHGCQSGLTGRGATTFMWGDTMSCLGITGGVGFGVGGGVGVEVGVGWVDRAN